jgi:ubiquitin C-terminal hydrolase
LASASRLLIFEGSDDDCQILSNTDASVQKHLGLSAQQLLHNGNDLRRSGTSSSILSPFSLVGNVMHTGRTLASGHYYADVLYNGSWIRVNDTSVSNIDWDPCRMQNPAWSNMAYVQIYAHSPAHSGSQMPVPQL